MSQSLKDTSELIVFAADHSRVLDGTYDQQGYTPKERRAQAKRRAEGARSMSPTPRKKPKGKPMSNTPPDRSADVNAICRAHPESFPPGEQNDPARLKLLTETMVPQINRNHPEDGGNWGILVKTDQGNKIPCDIMVWKPGTVTIDVMTGTGGTWQVQGSAQAGWIWAPAGGAAPPQPVPVPPQTNTIPYDNDVREVAFGKACNQAYTETTSAIDPGMIAVHAARDAYDFYVNRIPDPECHNKHVKEFRDEYKLPPVSK